MALEAELGVARGHSAAVVNYLYESPAGVSHDYGNLVRSCIYRIFNQLLYDGGRSLDHFSRRNQVGDILR